MTTLEVDWQNTLDSSSDQPLLQQVQEWCEAALQDSGDFEIAIRIVGLDESQSLNHEYRDKNRPTNVLSFPFELPPGLPEEAMPKPLPLGDLVICAPLVQSEAKAQGKTAEAHWAHLLIHGTLHLQGYDHIIDSEAEEMEELEREILSRFGYPDPYQVM